MKRNFKKIVSRLLVLFMLMGLPGNFGLGIKQVNAQTNLQIVNETLNDVVKYFTDDTLKEHYTGKYDDVMAMGLNYAGVEKTQIADNLNIRTGDKIRYYAINALLACAVGEKPENYNGVNYIEKILSQSEFYNSDKNILDYILRPIIVLDLSEKNYDKENAIKSVINKLNAEGEKLYVNSNWDEQHNVVYTAYTIIALSNHKDIDGVKEAIVGLKKYLKSKQDENGLIVACDGTAYVMQALIALGEDPLSEEWSKTNGKGNKVTLLDAMLACKDGNEFKKNPSMGWGSDDYTKAALVALADLKNNKSMYKMSKPQVVKKEVSYISIVPKVMPYMHVEETGQLKVIAKMEDDSIEDITNKAIYKSEDSNVVDINTTGLLTAKKEGKTEIKATYENKMSTTYIVVKNNKQGETPQEHELNTNKVNKSINTLKEYYNGFTGDKVYLYTTLLGFGLMEDKNESNISSRVKLYNSDSLISNAKNIMALVAANKEPKEYVDKIMSSKIKFYENKSPYAVAMGILALDMANADYDHTKAIKSLLDKGYIKENLMYYTSVEETTAALTAFAFHKSETGVKEAIVKIKNCLKLHQCSDGMIKEHTFEYDKKNCKATSQVISALIALGENPNSIEWAKVDESGKTNTLVDALLECDNEDGKFKRHPLEQYDVSGTYSAPAFQALNELIRNKSAYSLRYISQKETTSIHINGEHSINVIELDEKQFTAKTFNVEGKETTNALIIWESSDPKIATVQRGAFKAIKPGNVKITVKVKDNAKINDEISVTINKKPKEEIKYDKEISDLNIKMVQYYLKKPVLRRSKLLALNLLGKDCKEKFSEQVVKFNKQDVILDNLIGSYVLGIDYSKHSKQLADLEMDDGIFPKMTFSKRLDCKTQATSIWALDLVNQEYDVEKAVNKLLECANTDGSFGKNYKIENTALSIVALAKHKDIDGVNDKINISLEYLKSKQLPSGGFDEGYGEKAYLSAEVVQALIANGENVFSDEWTKNSKNLVDSIIDSYKDINFETIEVSKLPVRTERVFLALANLESKVARIEIDSLSLKKLKVGQKYNFAAKVFNNMNGLIEGKEFIWNSSNKDIAVVDENTGEITALSSGTVVISAMLKKDKSIKVQVSFNVIEKCDSKIKVRVEGVNKTLFNDKVEWDSSIKNPLDILKTAVGEKNIEGDNRPTYFITGILGEKHKENDGWCYYVKFKSGNIVIPSVGVEEFNGMTNVDNELIAEEIVFYKCSYSGVNLLTKIPVVHIENDGCNFKIKVTSNEVGNKPIKDVSIKVENEGIYKTNADGEASFKLNKAGKYSIEILKENNGYPEIVRQHITVESEGGNSQELQNVIEELKNNYRNKTDLKATIVMAYNSLMTGKSDYKASFKLNGSENAAAYAENIIGYLATGQDESEYVNKLVKSQNKEGKFVVKSTDEKSVTSLADSILALDMACADYNSEKAVDALVAMAESGHYEDVTTTAYVIRALTKHKDIEQVKNLIDSCIEYLQKEQLDNGGFDYYGMKNSPYSTGIAIGALLRAGEDLSKKVWNKNGRSIVDSLLACKLEGKGFEMAEGIGGGCDDSTATEAAFVALSDVYNGTSMYDKFTQESIPEEPTNEEKIQNAIDGLRDYLTSMETRMDSKYKQHPAFYRALETIALNCSSDAIESDIEDLAKKFNVNEAEGTLPYAMNIMGLKSSGRNPQKYIDLLRNGQQKDGSFEVGKVEQTEWAVIALDMVGAEYNKAKAAEYIVNKNQDVKDVSILAVAVTALAPHKDIAGVKEFINSKLDCINSKQLQTGGFEMQDSRAHKDIESSVPISYVISALVANGIDPLTDTKWIKDGNTLLDALLKFKKLNYFLCNNGQYAEYFCKDEATEQAFIALCDLKYKKSSYTKKYDKPEEDFTITRVGKGNLHLGEDAKVEINAKNNSDVEKPCMLIVALYDKDTGKMVNYSYVKKTVKSGETENMTSGFTMPEEGNYEVKAMIWDKLDNMKPLSDCIKLDVVE